MKNLKKVLFTVLILVVALVLVGCQSSNNPVYSLANNPIGDKAVFDFDETNINFQGEDGLSYWSITETSAVSEIPYEGSNPTNYETETTSNGGTIRTYKPTVYAGNPNVTITFKIYILPEDYVYDKDVDTDIAFIAYRYSKENALTTIGETYDFEGIRAYAFLENGDIIDIYEEEYANNPEDYYALFSDGNYDVFNPGDEGFKTFQAIESLSFSYEGNTYAVDGYVAGETTAGKPISSKDANWFDYILIIPVAFIMQLFAGLMGNNFALGILFTTIIIRTLAWPIYARTNDMSMKMSLAQPEINKLQNKYALKKDPQSQQMMQMEMMQLYKKYGIGFTGCLMPFLQMPIFIAMYRVVMRIPLVGGMYAEQVSNTKFLGIDLASGGADGFNIISLILAVVVGGTMFLLQRIAQKKPSYAKNTGSQNKNPQAEQTQKTMRFVSYFMVLMMAVFAYQSNALALYWVFGNAYSIGQTVFNHRRNEKKHQKLVEKELLG